MSKIRISSFDCSIFTPVKTGQAANDELTPEKNIPCEANIKRPIRFSASREQNELMISMKRSHSFLIHSQVKFSELERSGLYLSAVDDIQKYFKENMPDLHDCILKQEEAAIKIGEFCETKKKYISEEFDIPAEYSFLTICILCYAQEHNVSVAESANDLLCLFADELICEECSSSTVEHYVEENNFSVMKSLLNKSLLDVSHEDPFGSCDDSYCDPVFNPDLDLESKSSESDRSQHKDCQNILESSFESLEIFNPFAKPETDSQIINSTMRSNCKTERLFPAESSPIQHCKKRQIICKFCDKSFNKMFNLKMHLVHVHKYFPEGMTVYKCPVPDCTFVAGNKIIFNRHSHKKNVASSLSNSVFCNLCNERFATKGSLARHIGRIH